MIDQVGPFLLIGGFLQQMLHQQCFVAGRGHLSHEDHIVRVHIVLIFKRQIGMEGVAHLMGQRKLTVQSTGVIHQHVGMHHRTGRIGAAPFAHIFVDIHPSVFEAFLQDGLVFLTQRGHALINRLSCLCKGNLLCHTGKQRCIDVIKMQVLHPQQLLAQTHIAVELVDILMNRLNQVQIDGGGHVGPVQRRFQCGRIFPGIGKELQLLALGIEHGCGSVAEFTEGAIKIFIGAFAQRPVRAQLAGNEGALGQGAVLSLPIYCIREGDIRIGKGTENILRRAGHFSGGSQQLLLRRGQDMVLHPPGISQIPAVAFQPGLSGIKRIQLRILDGHNLRRLEAAGSIQGHHCGHEPSGHGLIGGIAGILVSSAHAVIGQCIQLPVHLLRPVQIVIQSLSIGAQFTCKRRKKLIVFLQCGKLRFPQFITGKEVLDGPLVRFGDLTSQRDSVFFHSCYLPILF